MKPKNIIRKPETGLITPDNEISLQLEEKENLEAKLIAANHDLEVFKEELMAQNEELILAREIAQVSSDKYFELFDFAPTCQYTISREGEIIELNISGALMLGKERSKLRNEQFDFYVSELTKPVFNHFLRDVFADNIKKSCEVNLSTNESEPVYVYISGIKNKSPDHCLINLIDITQHKIAQNLIIANNELVSLNKEKEKHAADLILANIELAYQNEEKEKRAAELIIAYKKLVLQNEEKEKRAAELTIANIELAYQNKEKEKRASELIIANKELAFQNEEKEKRASELIIANKELAFQNKEKEKRATELTLANKELAFQIKEKEKQASELNVVKLKAEANEEKLKLAAELIITNKELAFQIKETKNRAEELNVTNEELAYQIEEKEKKEVELTIAKNKAEESERIKSAFLANMSHEIRTPMNGVLGFTNLLKNPELTPDVHQKYVSMIEKGGERMLGIINDLIDISKIQSGMTNVSLSPCNVNELIEYTFSFFKPEIEKKGMRISCENSLTEKEAIILTDSEKIYAILTNLVKNAIKYSEKGTIEIGCYLDARYSPSTITFFIKDTGIGISADKLDAIFNRFEQVENRNMRSIHGVGLGLSIAKSYVEMLNGKIWVESELGKGSTFYFSLPYNNVPDEIKNTIKVDLKEGIDDPKKKLKILIADDDESSSLLTALIVKKYSSEVFTATNGFDAIDICYHHRDIDLVLMDINMPMMHGTEATRQIREFNKDVYIIAQTANVFAEDRLNIIEAGCDDYITKPLNQAMLVRLIKNHFQE